MASNINEFVVNHLIKYQEDLTDAAQISVESYPLEVQ